MTMLRIVSAVFVLSVFVHAELDSTDNEVRQKRKAEDLVPDNYLEQFGYLEEKEAGSQHDEITRSNAIKQFQRFAGLKPTGLMDRNTKKKMLAPRCGFPDVVKPKDKKPSGRRNQPSRLENAPLGYSALGSKWPKNSVAYKFVGYTGQLPRSSQRRAIYNALNKWAQVTPLNFRETTSGDAEILIKWGRYSHGDGYAFDGRGGTLAHAFFPGETDISGDTHFDEDEQWTERSKEGTNLEIVAAHEFGHALGLGHSPVSGALMQPFYGGYDPNYSLHNDDIRGVQSLYGGPRRESPTTRRPAPTRAPRPTTRRPRPTTRRPRPTTRRPSPTRRPTRPDTEDICDLKFDDIIMGHDNHMYAFREKKVYKFNGNGVGIQKGYPKNIRKVFLKAPSNIGAAVYDRRQRKTYFFKGSKFWRFTGFTRDPGYPKRLQRGWYRGAKAAIQEDNGEIRLLKGSQMSPWREDFRQPPRGYPVDVTLGWHGLRSDLEAAVKYNGYAYFFKGANYFKYNTRYRRVEYRKPKAAAWLGCGRYQPK